MGRAEGIPNDDAGLLRRALDGTPAAGIITFNGDFHVLQASGPAIDKAPSLIPGVNLREELEKLTHVEMVDRLLIRREIATFAGTKGGRDIHWKIWSESAEHDEVVMSLWDTDWSEVMHERRAAFTMAASHELREPLTTLLGFAEILNMDTRNFSPEQAEATSIIEETARHLAVLVEDVFDLSRNSFGELRLHLEFVDLAEPLEAVLSTARPRIEESGQTLESRIEGDLPLIEADPARVAQMLSNLVFNASIHNPEGTRIKVTAAADETWVKIVVADDGEGLPFDDPHEAFHTFKRGKNAVDGDRAGSGIGLSVSKRLVQLHRGSIDVESTPGEGTSFTLRFPIDRSTATEPGVPGPA